MSSYHEFKGITGWSQMRDALIRIREEMLAVSSRLKTVSEETRLVIEAKLAEAREAGTPSESVRLPSELSDSPDPRRAKG